MKKLMFGLLGLFVAFSTAGCQVMKDAWKGFEDGVKSPPTAVMDAGHQILNFVAGLLNVGFQFIFHGLLAFLGL